MAADRPRINPFARFREREGQRIEKPPERPLLGEREAASLAEAYLAVASDEYKRVAWLADLKRVEEVYDRALGLAGELEFSPLDLEEVLFRIEARGGPLIPGVAGLFISALINRHRADLFAMNLEDLRFSPGFMGYRLPGGKTLRVTGSLGDFTGAFLAGGTVEVSGDAGNYTGCSMTSGTIKVGGSAGLFTGDWMRGGEIEVAGDIRGLGQSIRGGVVGG